MAKSKKAAPKARATARARGPSSANGPEREEVGHYLGLHRVIDQKSRLPQAADKLDNTLPIFSNEILIDVERLNVDAASFVQMEKVTKSPEEIGNVVMANSLNQGKQHNRVTGSGGMLLGTVKQIGSHYSGNLKLKVGDRIATLVSLTLTPLHLEAVSAVDPKTHQLVVKGHAILFESGIAAKIPADLPERAALSVFDVAGAPALVAAHCKPGQTVVVIGAGGKAGILSCFAARQKVGKKGKVIGIEPFASAANELRSMGICNEVIEADATHPILVSSSVATHTRDKMGDVVVNVASVPDTEMSTVLSTRPKGTAIFFGMATSFTKVALGAEGVASSAKLIFGNGFYPGHAEYAVSLLGKFPMLKNLFLKRYAAD